MSFVGYLSSINCVYYICSDFIIHIDVVGNGYTFVTFLDWRVLKLSVSQPTSLHHHILDLILSPSNHDTIADAKNLWFLYQILQKSNVSLPFIMQWLII